MIYFKGYVIVKDFFTKEELEPCKKAIERFVDLLAQKLHEAGKIKGTCKLHKSIVQIHLK